MITQDKLIGFTTIDLIQFVSNMSEGKKTVWLDCDPGLDDTFAIIYAGHSKNIDLLGVSTSPGNTNLENTTENALDILYNTGRKDVPVFAGSNTLIKGQMKMAEDIHGSNGLGGVELPKSPETANKEGSFEKIYTKIMDHPTNITWLNTGSLTNLCILLLAYPILVSKLDQIVMMGGAIGKGNISPAAQFNVHFDPLSLEGVLRLKKDVPLVMIPLEVTHQNLATQDVLDHFASYKQIPLSQDISNMLLSFQKMYYQCQKFPFPPIHDPLTVFYLLHPEEIEVEKCDITVDTNAVSYGRTNVYLDSKNSSISVGINLKNEKTKFWEEMIEIFNHIFSKAVQDQIVEL